MYGAGMGDLFINVSSDSGSTWTTVDTISGDQGNQWNDKVVALPTSGVVMVQLKYTSGNAFTGDAALDNMRFMEMPIMGCMDQWAPNYNAAATIDDGSCLYPGCLDPAALNYCTSCNDTNNTLCIYPSCDSLPFVADFEDTTLTNWVMSNGSEATIGLVTASNAGPVNTGGAYGAVSGNVSLRASGMDAFVSGAWVNSSSETTVFNNTACVSSATYCLDLSNAPAITNMSFIGHCRSQYTSPYSWLRVKVNGTVIADDQGKTSYTNTLSASQANAIASWVGTLDNPTTLVYDLSSYGGQSSVNITFEFAQKYGAA
jgi:hypothetical protein